VRSATVLNSLFQEELFAVVDDPCPVHWGTHPGRRRRLTVEPDSAEGVR
jgi:hypothetical protein